MITIEEVINIINQHVTPHRFDDDGEEVVYYGIDFYGIGEDTNKLSKQGDK